jgi:hypothetical protein
MVAMDVASLGRIIGGMLSIPHQVARAVSKVNLSVEKEGIRSDSIK